MRTFALASALVIAACYLPASSPPPNGSYSGPPGGYTQAQPQQGYDPNQAQPQQGYDPDQQGYPQQGYDPQQGYPQQGYDPDQGYPQQQGYPPPQPSYAPQRECKSEYGTTVCGYHCVASYGQVRCADSPMGACAASYGNITCWSPSTDVRRAYRESGPAAQCVSEYGTTACGYGCAASYGEVRCAETPQGVCQAAYGQITCSN
ncbi:MAG: hypothetical protein K8W52_39200 [Deltaproteobacteria bacterium]|nr:hypothetical protein [Deltaproteobacteria bacterium]